MKEKICRNCKNFSQIYTTVFGHCFEHSTYNSIKEDFPDIFYVYEKDYCNKYIKEK